MAKGGARPGAGRKKGVPNKSTAAVKDIAAKYTDRAWQRLADLLESEDEKTAMAAVKELFDRAYGKAPQSLTGEGGEGPIQVTIKRYARD